MEGVCELMYADASTFALYRSSATFADSEDIQKLVVYRVQKERLPRPIREDAVVLSTTTRRYHSGEKELPLMVARV